MIDSYNAQYVFQDTFDSGDLRAVVNYLSKRCELLRPSDGVTDEYVAELDSKLGSVRLRYEGTVFDFRLGKEPELLEGLPLAIVSVPERWILTSEDDSESAAIDRMNAFYDFLGEIYEQFLDLGREPLYVFGTDFAEYEDVTDPEHSDFVSRDRILDREVPGVYWFQIYPPEHVEAIGRERLQSCPAYRLEELSDGAILLAGTQGVHVSNQEEYRITAAEHLLATSDG